MASVVPEQKEQEQGQEQGQWTDKFNKEVKASDKESILAWYNKSKDPVKNPAYLIGLDDEGKKLFEYIIEGIILSIEEGPKKAATVKEIVDKLKKYYLSLPESESDNELVIIDLLVKVSEDVPNLQLKKAFPMPDFQYHVPEGWLNSVDFYEFCGLPLALSQEQKAPVNPRSFLTHIKATLAPKKIKELENLADIYEEDTLNLRYKFKYNLKKAAMTNSIVLCIVKHLIANYESYDMETLLDKLAKVKLSILFLYEDFYTTINSSGLSPPIGLFRDFYNLDLTTGSSPSQMEEENVGSGGSEDSGKNQLYILYWYFKKIERLFEHTAVSEIKTQEALYDLFDLIEVDDIEVSENRKVHVRDASSDQEQIYPLRTIHFRKDFKVGISDTITIEQVRIPPTFWRAIDKCVCHPRKLPFSYFYGIITSEQLLLRPLYAMLVDETKSMEGSSDAEPIVEVLDDIAAAIGAERCIPRNTTEGLIKEMYSGIEGDGYELNEETAAAELSISTLLQMSALNLVYAANVKATYITKVAAAHKLEGMAYVYLNYAINKAINTDAITTPIKSVLSTAIDVTGKNAATFITTAYYNYFNNEIKYTVDVEDPLGNLLALLTQVPALATAERS